ncbi:MAG: type II toxin-antitoxin system prevent-host-death family antitoxin [Treponema sp.]|nr:type II toxin-antitoxin system prevent-host-death family antitoxin [Treponema sp.]
MALALVAAGNNSFDVGAFEAKTYFAELLRKVQDGAVINISKNGKHVAVLQGKQTVCNEVAFAAHRRIMARGHKIAEFRKKNGLSAITAAELMELKNDGRKY